MGRSRRRFKKGKPKAKVGLPAKRRGANVLPKAQTLILPSKEIVEWDVAGTLSSNYGAAGFVLDPNQAVGRRRLQHGGLAEAAGAPEGGEGEEGRRETPGVELENSIPAIFEEDEEPQELQVALGKRRKGNAAAPRYERLTKMQRVHVLKLIERHGLDYQAMARDLKFNKLQQTPGSLKFLCARYLACEPCPPNIGLQEKLDALEAGGG